MNCWRDTFALKSWNIFQFKSIAASNSRPLILDADLIFRSVCSIVLKIPYLLLNFFGQMFSLNWLMSPYFRSILLANATAAANNVWLNSSIHMQFWQQFNRSWKKICIFSHIQCLALLHLKSKPAIFWLYSTNKPSKKRLGFGLIKNVENPLPNFLVVMIWIEFQSDMPIYWLKGFDSFVKKEGQF